MKCTTSECTMVAKRRGLCNGCYNDMRRGIAPRPRPLPRRPPRPCESEKCERRAIAKGLCRAHYDAQRVAAIRARGECVACRRPYGGKHYDCDDCREAKNAELQDMRDARLRAGLCIQCAKRPARGLATKCTVCGEKDKGYARAQSQRKKTAAGAATNQQTA